MTGLFFSLKVTSAYMIFGKNSGVPAGLPCVRQSQDIVHYIKNIAVILFAVAISTYAPILLLLLPQCQQLFPDVADQRQGAQAGFRLGAVGADDFTFAVYLCVGYNVLNGDGVPLKVDGVPFQPQRLAAAQAVKGAVI